VTPLVGQRDEGQSSGSVALACWLRMRHGLLTRKEDPMQRLLFVIRSRLQTVAAGL
jgi:hypothetical protein